MLKCHYLLALNGSFDLKGKEHKNTNEFCLNVFGKLHSLMQILSFEDIVIVCFQNGGQWRPLF